MDENMIERLTEHSRRLQTLEDNHRELSSAINKLANSQDSRREHIDYRFNSMNDRFNKLDANIGKLLWLIGAAIVGGVMQFLLKGGLTVVS